MTDDETIDFPERSITCAYFGRETMVTISAADGHNPNRTRGMRTLWQRVPDRERQAEAITAMKPARHSGYYF